MSNAPCVASHIDNNIAMFSFIYCWRHFTGRLDMSHLPEGPVQRLYQDAPQLIHASIKRNYIKFDNGKFSVVVPILYTDFKLSIDLNTVTTDQEATQNRIAHLENRIVELNNVRSVKRSRARS